MPQLWWAAIGGAGDLMGCVVDRRTGSSDLLLPLRKQGVDAAMGDLQFGDIAFEGNGPDECPIQIGVEFKQVMDVLKCITDGRFSGHQLPGLVASYQYAWLLIEGDLRGDMHSGVLQLKGNKGYWHNAFIGQRSFMYKDFMSWLHTMDLRGGVRVARTQNRTESIFWLSSLYHWFTAKTFEEHRSHLAARTTADGDRAVLVRPSLMRRIAAELPGIGWERSGAVCQRFGSVGEMVTATAAEWREVEGVGEVISERIYKELNR